MIQDCVQVFLREYQKHGDRLILDRYIPADGTYVIVQKDRTIKDPVQVKLDKKTRKVQRDHPDFPMICFYDYQTRLIDMNKPQDPKKVIHSNSYLAFSVKKDSIGNGKLTAGIIEGYYSVLANPASKYEKSQQGRQLYQAVEEELGAVDQEALLRNKEWILQHIYDLPEVDLDARDYLKIFFEADLEDYQRESKRYLLPNIFNSNDFNEQISGKIYGLPNNNMGMNAKKPFLEAKTKKLSIPCLVDLEEALLQKKFFDYLMNFAAAGQNNIYVNPQAGTIQGYENGKMPSGSFRGHFLRIQKVKELEIHHQDVITAASYTLKRPFSYCNILHIDFKGHADWEDAYHTYLNGMEIQSLLNEVLFSKCLENNYFTKPEDLRLNPDYLKHSLLTARDSLFQWLFKGVEGDAGEVLSAVTLELLRGSIADGFLAKASRQFNLRWSILLYFKMEGAEKMEQTMQDVYELLKEKMERQETAQIESDDEYFFAVGQLAAYFISFSKGLKKPYEACRPFYNAQNDVVIKNHLKQFFWKYSYHPKLYSKRFNNIYAMVSGYIVKGAINHDLIIAGILHSNVIYYKEEK